MYTFCNVEVVHIPDQTSHSDEAMGITLYTFTRNQSLVKRLFNTSATSCLRELPSQN